ncbi:hypothetical protein EUA66_02255 [TM7 phylum sp. oral taxon 349]|nr:hypothetical protein EUA66_02255 [TM7 phylum sp. oral taxon 349]
MSSNKNHTKINWQTIAITVLAIALAVNSFLLYAFYWLVGRSLSDKPGRNQRFFSAARYRAEKAH